MSTLDALRHYASSEDEDASPSPKRSLPYTSSAPNLIHMQSASNRSSPLVEPPPPKRPPSAGSDEDSHPQPEVKRRRTISGANDFYSDDDFAAGAGDAEDSERPNRSPPAPQPGGHIEDEEELDEDEEAELLLDQVLEEAQDDQPVSQDNSPSLDRQDENVLESAAMALDNVTLPPLPTGQCSTALQERLDVYLAKKQAGSNPNVALQSSKKFRNPSMYEKIIDFMSIDERGTNFPKNIFDPNGFRKSDYYDELSKTQRVLMDKIEKEKKTDGPTAVTAAVGSAAETLLAAADKKKSRFH